MRLGRPQRSQDQEKDAPDLKPVHETPLIARVIAHIFRTKQVVPGGAPTEMEEEPQNLNLFPRQLHDADKGTYSPAESQQTSAKLWSIYISEAERYDKALVESWKGDMEGMLIFSGLFSASLTAFLIESYRTLQPDSGDLTVQLLTQLVAISTNTSVTLPDPIVFKPTVTSLVCNTCWFISLALSITCALLATLVETWAREFLHKTEKRPSPIRRGRVFSFLYFGVRRFGMHVVVDLIPMLLHISLVLFLSGLVAFLQPINHLMMGLISGVLAVFLLMYAVITFLPLISLDCPYRTPFSGLMWSSLQRLRHHTNFFPSSSTASNMNDAMVDIALQGSGARDQRAFTWTLQSLTDDDELLPFLEAIPEAIVGPKGFHLVNDSLFIPLLSKSSLGRRIADLMLSCQNMMVDDPRREKGLITGMKAIWALGIISGRTGDMFDHGGHLWFDRRTRNAIRPPRMNAVWPRTYATSARAAMDYSWMNNFRHLIASLGRQETGDTELMKGIQMILERTRTLSVTTYSTSLDAHLKTLEAWSTNPKKMATIRDIKELLKLMTKSEIWLEANASIVTRLLLDGADGLHEGGEFPYEYLQTCLKIVPVVPPNTASRRMKRSVIFHRLNMRHFDPSHYTIASGQVSGFDWIMRCFLRILPLLRPEDAIPAIVSYLTTRNDLGAIRFATKECIVPYLLDDLVAVLSPQMPDPIVLDAICMALAVQPTLAWAEDWYGRAEEFWNYLSHHGILTTSSPQLLALSRIMTLGKYQHIRTSAFKLGDPSRVGDVLPHDITTLRNLALHPLLPGKPPDHPKCTPEDLASNISTRAKEAMITTMTDFILACVEAVKPAHLLDVIPNIFWVLPLDCQDVGIQAMSRFGHSWSTLIHSLLEDPDNVELKHVIYHLFLRDGGPLNAFYNPETAALFLQPLVLYLEWLEDQPNNSGLSRAQTAVDELKARMTLDGVAF